MGIAYNPLYKPDGKTKVGALTSAPINDIVFDLPGKSIWAKGVKFKGTDTTYSVFKKHTSNNSGGYDGLVPVPSYNNNSKTRFLREDGTWEVPTEKILTFNPTSISLTTGWKASGFILRESNGFQTGVYGIKIMSGNLMFSGVASVVVGKITTEDEIMLHMSGMPQVYADGTQGRIYAKIAPSETADYGEIYLATNVPQSAITNLSITMKKII